MGKVEQLNTAADVYSEDIANLGFDLRGYLHALNALLMEMPEMSQDGPWADAVGMQLKRMNDIADQLRNHRFEPTKTLKPLD